ncbi:MAG: hypothetical protein HYW07_01850 [Candidatus Latescibacteria bacterium]|nr:hypothetical protein [Candidatus Latescibacterota bacterium]
MLFACSAACAAFEISGGGARTAALGGAFGAGADATEGIWINPAGNARVHKWRVGTTHVLLYPGLEDSPALNTLAASSPVGGGALQLGVSGLSARDWQEQVAVVGYGRGVHPRVALGGDVRMGGWKTVGLSHRAWSADVGGVYEAGWIHPRLYLRLGLALRELTRANLAAGGQAAGRSPRVMALAACLSTREQRQLVVDVEMRGGRTLIRAGYETLVADLAGMRLRVGGSAFPGNWEGGEMSMGIGHNWRQWHFDFAYTYPLGPSSGLGGVHRLSLGYRQP